jgi:hypothetical protein
MRFPLRTLLILLLQAGATAVSFVVARERMLPHDLSYLPLSIVLGSQCCLLALWVAHGRASWPLKAFLVIAYLGLSAAIRWLADRMFVPADLAFYSAYLVGTPVVPLFGLVLSEAMLHQWRRGNRDHCTLERIRYSILDLLTLMLVCGAATAVLVTFPADHSKFQYNYGAYDYVLYLSMSSALAVMPCLIIFRACLAREFQFRTVTLVLMLTLIVGRLASWSLGIKANPLWAAYTLGPCLTVSLVALALTAHRSTLSLGSGASASDQHQHCLLQV